MSLPPDPLRELMRSMALRSLRWFGRGGAKGWNGEDSAAPIGVAFSPKNAVAATASCVAANDILECLMALKRGSERVEATLGPSTRRLEFVSKAEAVALAQLAVDRGYLERVGRGPQTTTSHLRRALLDAYDRVAARRRTVFRSGAHRYWRFVLPKLYDDQVTVEIGKVTLPADAEGVLPVLGYVSACVRVDLVVLDNYEKAAPSISALFEKTGTRDHSSSSSFFFPRQRHRSTMVRRVCGDFELNESIRFALPKRLQDRAYFVVQLANEGAHGVLHAKVLGSTRISFKDAMGSAMLALLDDRERAAASDVANCGDGDCSCSPIIVQGPCPPLTSEVRDVAKVALRVEATPRGQKVPKLSPQEKQRRGTRCQEDDDDEEDLLEEEDANPTLSFQKKKKKKKNATVVNMRSPLVDLRVRGVILETRNVTYDLAETHGLRWMLRVQLTCGDAEAETPWATKIFNEPQFFSNAQRIRGGGARFSFPKDDQTPGPRRREADNNPSAPQRQQRPTSSEEEKKKNKSEFAFFVDGRRRLYSTEKQHSIDFVTPPRPDFLDRRRRRRRGTTSSDEPLARRKKTEATTKSFSERLRSAFSSDAVTPEPKIVVSHSTDAEEEDDSFSKGDESEEVPTDNEEESVVETPLDDVMLPRDTEVLTDTDAPFADLFFPKLKVETSANMATDIVRLIVMQKSFGGIARRIGAVVLPLAELPRSPPSQPSWHVLTNVGPRGVLTRNGQVKASLWIDDDDDDKVIASGSQTTKKKKKKKEPLKKKTSWRTVVGSVASALKAQLFAPWRDDLKAISNFLKEVEKWWADETKTKSHLLVRCCFIIFISAFLLIKPLRRASWNLLSDRRLLYGALSLGIFASLVAVIFFLDFVGPLVLAKIIGMVIEKFGVQDACRCECEAIRIGVFLTRATAADLPPTNLVLTKRKVQERKKRKVANHYGPPKGRHWRLVVSLEVRGFRFYNPAASRYPHETMATVKQVDLTLSMALRHVPSTLRRLWTTKWRPNPRHCVAAFGLADRMCVYAPPTGGREGERQKKTQEEETKRDSAAMEDEDEAMRASIRAAVDRPYQQQKQHMTWQATARRPRAAGVVVVEKCEILAPQVNMEMDAASELNVVALTRDLADARVAKFLPTHQFAPNTLKVEVLAARNLPYQKPPPTGGYASVVAVNCADFSPRSVSSPSSTGKFSATPPQRTEANPPPDESPPSSSSKGSRPGQLLFVRCRVRDEHRRDSGLSSPLAFPPTKENTTTTGLAAKWSSSAAKVEFRDRYDDASAVLALELFASEPLSSKGGKTTSIGRWLTTLEALANHPSERLVRASDDFYARSASEHVTSSSFEVEGWFPLRDADLEYADPRDKQDEGFGSVRLKVTWYHDVAAAGHSRVTARRAARRQSQQQHQHHQHDAFAAKSALEQLTENARESGLRLGSPRYTERMLDTFPLLIDVRALVLVDVNARLHDIFMGKTGEAYIGSGDQAHVQIPKIILDADDFITKNLKYEAMSIAGFLRDFVIRGCAPGLLSRSLLYQVISNLSVVPE